MSAARDRILLTAHDLFYRHGIRATGIDRIIREAGVTKVTFYRHFPSKDELIAAFLEYRHELWMNWFNEALTRHQAQGSKGLMTLPPVMAEWFKRPEFRGCAFINSVAELGENTRVMEISRAHKQDMTRRISELLPAGRSRNKTAQAAALAVDGAIFQAQLAADSKQLKAVLLGLRSLLECLSDA